MPSLVARQRGREAAWWIRKPDNCSTTIHPREFADQLTSAQPVGRSRLFPKTG
jgi:hypothetical protein